MTSPFKNPNKSFFAASTLYALCVIILSIHSYIILRASTLNTARQHLTNAILATQSILEEDDQNAAETLDCKDHPARCKKEFLLNRMIATNNLLIAGALSNSGKPLIITGSDSQTNRLDSNTFINEATETKDSSGKIVFNMSILSHDWVVSRHINNVTYFAACPAHETKKLLRQHRNHELTTGLFLLILILPLLASHRTAEHQHSQKMATINAQLRHDVKMHQLRATELSDAISDLERFNSITADREIRIIELKNEVNDLLKTQNDPPKYSVDPS